MQPWHPSRAEIPSKKLMLLHIHDTDQAPGPQLLTEILDLGIICASCKVISPKEMANRQ